MMLSQNGVVLSYYVKWRVFRFRLQERLDLKLVNGNWDTVDLGERVCWEIGTPLFTKRNFIQNINYQLL